MQGGVRVPRQRPDRLLNLLPCHVFLPLLVPADLEPLHLGFQIVPGGLRRKIGPLFSVGIDEMTNRLPRLAAEMLTQFLASVFASLPRFHDLVEQSVGSFERVVCRSQWLLEQRADSRGLFNQRAGAVWPPRGPADDDRVKGNTLPNPDA